VFGFVRHGKRDMMMAETKWTELLTCPNCRQSGPVHLSQPEGRAYDFSVEAVPVGFKVVRTEYSETFFCSACDRDAITSYARGSV
jgi:hypothetical protein